MDQVERAKAAILFDLRDRKLLKYLFDANPEACGAYGYVAEPIELTVQEEIAEALARAAIEAMADPDTLRPREALVEAREALALGAAIPLVDSRCSVEVTALCDTFGYGAVMSTASVLWRELLKADGIDGGEFCAGPCRGTAESVIAKIDAALTAHIKEEGK